MIYYYCMSLFAQQKRIVSFSSLDPFPFLLQLFTFQWKMGILEYKNHPNTWSFFSHPKDINTLSAD
jgi:hypothetical protein